MAGTPACPSTWNAVVDAAPSVAEIPTPVEVSTSFCDGATATKPPPEEAVAAIAGAIAGATTDSNEAAKVADATTDTHLRTGRDIRPPANLRDNTWSQASFTVRTMNGRKSYMKKSHVHRGSCHLDRLH
jgi:hypothetical protein